jgi:hypothetical protein
MIDAAQRGQIALLRTVVFQAALADAQQQYDQCVKAAAAAAPGAPAAPAAKPVCQVSGGRWQGGETVDRTMLVSSNTKCGRTLVPDADTVVAGVSVSDAAHGTAHVDGLGYTYQSNEGYHGPDSFMVAITVQDHPNAYINVSVTVIK